MWQTLGLWKQLGQAEDRGSETRQELSPASLRRHMPSEQSTELCASKTTSQLPAPEVLNNTVYI